MEHDGWQQNAASLINGVYETCREDFKVSSITLNCLMRRSGSTGESTHMHVNPPAEPPALHPPAPKSTSTTNSSSSDGATLSGRGSRYGSAKDDKDSIMDVQVPDRRRNGYANDGPRKTTVRRP